MYHLLIELSAYRMVVFKARRRDLLLGGKKFCYSGREYNEADVVKGARRISIVDIDQRKMK